ncbi:hypothetical protein L345_07006, partial [Ophiophagus hannah]
MTVTCVVWGIFWLIILFFIGWPISIFLGGLYGFFSPLITLIGLDDFSELLLKGQQPQGGPTEKESVWKTMSEADEEGGGEEGYEDVGEKEPKKADTEALLPPPEKKASVTTGTLSCCCLLWSLVWLMILVAFAWPLSVAMAALYGFVSPMISLIGLDDISESMLQAVHVGRECAKNVRTGRAMV